MTGNHPRRTGMHPVTIALAVAIFGMLAILIVDHGPWSRAHVQAAGGADHGTTGVAARTAGPDPD